MYNSINQYSIQTFVWRYLARLGSISINSLLFVLFCMGLVTLFIPIPRMGLPVSLSNVIYVSGLLLLLGKLRNIKSRILGRPLRLSILVIGFMFIQYFTKLVVSEEAPLAFDLIRRSLLVLMGVASIDTWQRFRFAILIVVASVLFSTGIGVMTVMDNPFAQRISQIHNTLIMQQQENNDIDIDQQLNLAQSRVMGLSSSVFGFSYLLAPTILLLMGLAMDYGGRRLIKFWLAVAGLFLMGFAFILNGERSALVALGVGLFLLFRKRLSRASICVLIITVMIVYSLININQNLLGYQDADQDNLIKRIQSGEVSGDIARIGLAVGGFMTVLQNPITGGSDQDYQYMLTRVSLITDNISWWGTLPAPHNAYINAGRRAGIIGWIILGIILVMLWRTGLAAENWQVPEAIQNTTRRGLSAALAAVLTNAIFHNAGIMSAEPMTWALIAICFSGAVLDRQLRD